VSEQDLIKIYDAKYHISDFLNICLYEVQNTDIATTLTKTFNAVGLVRKPTSNSYVFVLCNLK